MQGCCHLDKKNKTNFCRKKTMPHYHKYRHLINRPDGLIFILSGDIPSPQITIGLRYLAKVSGGKSLLSPYVPTGINMRDTCSCTTRHTEVIQCTMGSKSFWSCIQIVQSLWATDHKHMMAKSLILFGPNLKLNKYLRFGYWGLVFCQNNDWLMENIDKWLTVVNLWGKHFKHN